MIIIVLRVVTTQIRFVSVASVLRDLRTVNRHMTINFLLIEKFALHLVCLDLSIKYSSIHKLRTASLSALLLNRIRDLEQRLSKASHAHARRAEQKHSSTPTLGCL